MVNVVNKEEILTEIQKEEERLKRLEAESALFDELAKEQFKNLSFNTIQRVKSEYQHKIYLTGHQIDSMREYSHEAL